MIHFPNWTVSHPSDVVEGIQKELRKDKHGNQALPGEAAEQPSWDAVDQALSESFPASDPPPWTLGYTFQEEAVITGRSVDE